MSNKPEGIRSNKIIEKMMLFPFLILFFMFTVLPVLASLGLSFTDFDMLQRPSFQGFSNYMRLFLEDDVFIIALKTTLVFAFITGPVSYFAALIFAWLINELKPRVRSVFTLLFYAPSIAGNVYFMWMFIFSGDSYGIVIGIF